MTTVLIPAHNEAEVIQSCLFTLLAEANDGEFEVLVLANGCADDTVKVALSASAELGSGNSVAVIDRSEAGKAAAINHGLAVGTGPSYIVLDADCLLETDTARQLVAALNEPEVLAASTHIGLQFDRVSWPSRSYHRFWRRVPSVANGLAGRGVYALTSEAIDRIGALPKIVADDRFVDLAFGVSERRIVSGSCSVEATGSVKELIERKSRVFLGNNSLVEHQVPGFDPLDRPKGKWLSVLRQYPTSLIDLPMYLSANLVAKLKAKRMASNRREVSWNQSRSKP